MAPFKSSLAKSAGKLLGVFREADLSLRGATQNTRLFIPPVELVATNSDSTNPGGSFKYITWIVDGSFTVSNGPVNINYLLVGGGASGAGQNGGGSNGTPSTALGLTAYGGGSGRYYQAGVSFDGYGASGGGGGGGGSPTTSLGNKVTGTNTDIAAPLSPQGNSGGTAPAIYGGAGGGGAGAAGGNSSSNSSHTAGGIGAAAMSGDANFPTSYGTAGPSPGRWFAAGGGGSGGNPNGSAPAQPVGGGGAGINRDPGGATGNAVANTGSGGGAYTSNTGGGSGGGGAGGFLSSSMVLTDGSYPITIGSGGTTPADVGEGANGIFVIRVPSGVNVT